MRSKILPRRRIDYQNSPEDLRILSMYLQAGEIRKKKQLLAADSSAARFMFYGVAGLFLLTGLFFVFF